MQVTIALLFTKEETELVKTPWSCLSYDCWVSSLPLGSAIFTVQPVWIPSYPFPDRFIFSETAFSTSPTSRNCSIHPSVIIHCVILATSSALFIMASKDLSLANLSTSPLPLAHCGHARTMCLTFWDGYPHCQLRSCTSGTFLLYR